MLSHQLCGSFCDYERAAYRFYVNIIYIYIRHYYLLNSKFIHLTELHEFQLSSHYLLIMGLYVTLTMYCISTPLLVLCIRTSTISLDNARMTLQRKYIHQ